MVEWKYFSPKNAHILAKLGSKLAKTWYMKFLAFLAFSREK